MALIEVKNVSKTFQTKAGKVEALKNINFNVEAGDIYGIIGMSGAGKSTLVRCLNFLEKPTKGTVTVDGKDLGSLSKKDLRATRGNIGMIFQGFNLLIQSKVIDNVLYPLRLQRMPKADAKKKAKGLLEIVGLADKANAYPAQLSGGQQQRVAIARALASDPKILLCDEATSALDPQTTEQILQLLKEINQKTGITIVIITHSMSVVREICKSVAIVEKGEIVEDGSVEEIFTNPKSAAAKTLVFGQADSAPGAVSFAKDDNTKKVRIVFSTNSSYESVIADMILKFQNPVNILRANTLDVDGVARGEMFLQLSSDPAIAKNQVEYLKERGLAVSELTASDLVAASAAGRKEAE